MRLSFAYEHRAPSTDALFSGGAGFNGTCTFSNFTQPVQRESVFVTGNCTDENGGFVTSTVDLSAI